VASLNILFTSRARREMREILGFIAQDNLDAASRLAERIMSGLDHKARYPKSGRVIPEVPEHPARELVMPPCRIFYITDQTTLHVLSIMRSERLLQPEQLEN
jgi:plasmid stabilization system protein ParE